MGAGSGPPHAARVIHHGTDELLIEQDSVPDGEITLPIEERNQQAHPLGSSLPDLIDVRQPEVLYLGSPPGTEFCRPLDWFPEKCSWSGPDEETSDTREDDRGALGDIKGEFPFSQPSLKIVEV
jgi:hypothetical protein